jgi:hypothetical protein
VIAELLAVAALATGPVPLLDVPAATDVAVAGDQVVVARPVARGGIRVDAVSMAGGPARRLLDARVRGWSRPASVSLSASSERVAAVAWYSKGHGHLSAIRFQTRLYTGPPSGPLRRVALQGRWQPTDISVDGDRVAVMQHRGRLGPSRARVLLPDGSWQIVPWAGPAMGVPIALAGEHVAFDLPDRYRLVVLDLTTGARELSAADTGGPAIDLGADGRLLFTRGSRNLFTAPPRRRLPGRWEITDPHFAGAAVVGHERVGRFYDFLTRPAVLDPGALAPRPVGLPSVNLPALDADAEHVAWIANGCVLSARVGAAAPAEPPPGPCPRAEAAVSRRGFTLHGRTLRFEAACVAAPASGCTGTTAVRVLGHRAIAARGAFHVEPGARHAFTIRFTRTAARSIRQRVRAGEYVFLRARTRVADGRAWWRGPFALVGRVT